MNTFRKLYELFKSLPRVDAFYENIIVPRKKEKQIGSNISKIGKLSPDFFGPICIKQSGPRDIDRVYKF